VAVSDHDVIEQVNTNELAAPGEAPLSNLDVQFRMYYQFLKHAFGFRFLPSQTGVKHHVILQLDGHSSQHHTATLKAFVEGLPVQLNREMDLSLSVSYVSSERLRALQACDLLVGAAGFYGNKHHERRPGNRRGMSTKQKIRLSLAKAIYDALRELNRNERGSGAFNWFETTGRDGDWENLFRHKMRIWKIIPRQFQIDAGWQNDHLSRGEYQGVDIRPEVMSASRYLQEQAELD
jgi:hypothetical protein